VPRNAGGLPRPLAGDGPRYHSCHVVRELAEAEIRTEKLERVNTHLYETGGMRRVDLRGHNNILKRLLIHVGVEFWITDADDMGSWNAERTSGAAVPH